MTIKSFLNDYEYMYSNIYYDIKVNDNLVDYAYLVSIENLEIKKVNFNIKYDQLGSYDIKIFDVVAGETVVLPEDLYTIIVPSGAIIPRLEINIIV